MHGANFATDENLGQENLDLAREIVAILSKNDLILKDYQTACGGCGSPKLVYKSPDAYRIGQLLTVLKMRGYV